MDKNQHPEQKARDNIDRMLVNAGWTVQAAAGINFNVGIGIAVREYPTDRGPADYILFVEREPVGLIEAKREAAGYRLTTVEEQSQNYAEANLKWVPNKPAPRFIYESTGVLTQFRDMNDPKPRSRRIFGFHKPETLRDLMAMGDTLRGRLLELPPLSSEGLRECQHIAINNLEESFKKNRPKALMQMATGSGKTYTAITAAYRLLKHAGAKRILFLVDTVNLGEQAEGEFLSYLPADDNRKFSELYGLQRLRSSNLQSGNQIYISTIQRLYSILQGEEMDESNELENPAEHDQAIRREPLPVVYNERVPPEFFDFIIIDECHRSIYNLWRQVLEYFDAFLIGLTATPEARTFAFFDENIVSEYSHERAVADGVNVGYDIFLIDTDISADGGTIEAQEWVEVRNRLTRAKRWEQLDEEKDYRTSALDRKIVNLSQIRKIISTFKASLPRILPGRNGEVPKTLIFAKNDSHADDIIKVVRKEFNEGNEFCRKVTYRAEENPKSTLAKFRNSYNPRIAVTVDMIATGTDVRALECLLFMRDVRSRNYFEQMKGRGTRVIDSDELQKVSPAARVKDHFVIVDAVGVTRSHKTDSRALERKRTVPMKDLFYGIMMGNLDEDTCLSLANRLARRARRMTDEEKQSFADKAGGMTMEKMSRALLDAHDPDALEARARKDNALSEEALPTEEQLQSAQKAIIQPAAHAITGELIEFQESVNTKHDQIIDSVNIDSLRQADWAENAHETAERLVHDFRTYIEENKDKIVALRFYYSQPARLFKVNYSMYREALDQLKQDKPELAPTRVWHAFEQMEKVDGGSPEKDLTILVSLIRRVTGIDQKLTHYKHIVDRNFQRWILNRHKGAGTKFNEEQMEWLRLMRDHISASFHLEREDMDFTPFDSMGGLGKMHELFGDTMDALIDELNEALVA